MRYRYAVLLGLVLALPSPSAFAAAFIVTTDADSGPGSLRAAIAAANDGPGADLIRFAPQMAGRTIWPMTSLPVLSGGGLTVQGDISGDGKPDVQLDGASCGGNGLELRSTGNTIRGLAITRFDHGIAVVGTAATDNLVVGCYLGVDAAGSGPLGNYVGVEISEGASGNTIGGTTAASRNIISGNRAGGVFLMGCGRNLVAGNYIGLSSSGDVAVPNDVGINLWDAFDCQIGTGTAGGGNVIAGSWFESPMAAGRQAGQVTTAEAEPYWAGGITIVYGGGHCIVGNRIGTDAAGQRAVPGTVRGIGMADTTGITIGGNGTRGRNIISGCGWGVYAQDSSRIVVQGNYLGLNAEGTASVPDGIDNVFLANCSDTLIGGRKSAARNVVGGGTSDSAIRIANCQRTRVWGNYLGLSADGRQALGDVGGGVLLEGAPSDTWIGAPEPGGPGNVIADKQFWAVSVPPGAVRTVICNNVIGTDPTGKIARPIRNQRDGVIRVEGVGTRIGGPGAGNSIACASGQTAIWWAGVSGGLVRDNALSLAPGQPARADVGLALYAASPPATGPTPLLKGNILTGFRQALQVYPTGEFAGSIVTGNTFGDCDYGVYVYPGASPRLGNLRNVRAEGNGANRFRRIAEMAVENRSQARILAEGNDWGTSNPKAIAGLIFDGRDWPDFGVVDFTPFLRQTAATPTTALQLTGLAAAPCGAGAELVFALTASASVTAEVRNVAGRPVALLPAREYGAGPCRLSWSGRTSQGASAPAGRYLIRVTARDRSGAAASAVATATIRG